MDNPAVVERVSAISEDAGGLSLFSGDPFWSFLRRIRCADNAGPLPLLVAPLAVASLWLPIALLSVLAAGSVDAFARESFLRDYAALTQLVFCIPAFLIAERHLDWRVRSFGQHLLAGHLVKPERRAELRNLLETVEVRRHYWTDSLWVPLGLAVTWVWVLDELRLGTVNWMFSAGSLTPAGLWAALVSIPILNGWWFRWAWKAGIWFWLLFRLSRLELRIRAEHPDGMGGLGMLSWVQMGFAFVVFTIGCTMTTTVFYNVTVRGQELVTFSNWSGIIAFTCGAPVLFLAPLLFFTSQLLEAKQRGLHELGVFGAEYSARFQEWEYAVLRNQRDMIDTSFAIGGLADLAGVSEVVRSMRVVPFDGRSVRQFLGSVIVPIVPVLIRFAPLPAPLDSLLAPFR